MKITVTKKAQKWFESEMGISSKRGVRFFGQVYGHSPMGEGFSLAIEANEPSNPVALTVENNIPYFVETGDEWFFDGHNLLVDFDEDRLEPLYRYEK